MHCLNYGSMTKRSKQQIFKDICDGIQLRKVREASLPLLSGHSLYGLKRTSATFITHLAECMGEIRYHSY